jgi:hypothetical protein
VITAGDDAGQVRSALRAAASQITVLVDEDAIDDRTA